MLRFCQVGELLLQTDGTTHVFPLSLWREEKMLEKISIGPATFMSMGKTTFLEMSALLSHRHLFCGPFFSVSITVVLLMMVDHNIFLSQLHIGQLGHVSHNQNLLYCLLQQLFEVTHHLWPATQQWASSVQIMSETPPSFWILRSPVRVREWHRSVI